MIPRIETIAPKLLAALKCEMSLTENRTQELWRRFMQVHRSILHRAGADRYSLQSYPSGYFTTFDPARPYTKWAAIEIHQSEELPGEIEELLLPGGLYAVFHHRAGDGPAPEVFNRIFTQWLPASPYQVDDRLHFEVLGEAYRQDSPDAEEDIYIPIALK